MKVVLVMFKDNERRDFPLVEKTTVLGRRQECQLRIPTRDVSRQHCEVTLDKNTLSVKDMGSSNGTFVNGKRVAESELKAGDRLRIGPVSFVVQVDGQPAKIETPPAPAPEPAEAAPPAASGTAAGVLAETEDEETFDLSEADFDLDDPLAALEELTDDDDDKLP